jgi:hypothetical protein
MKIRRTYLPPLSLRETPPRSPTEMELQALWFEQLYQPALTTDDGRTVEIIQPGFWNHGGGPDFSRAAVRFSNDDNVIVGSIEVHLRADDWHLHGHHADPSFTSSGKRSRAKHSFLRRAPSGACHRSCSVRN